MVLGIHDTVNDLPNYRPINPFYYSKPINVFEYEGMKKEDTPLKKVIEVIDELARNVNDKSYEKQLMLQLYRNVGAHRYFEKPTA